ncbi:hypothetical protein BHH47_02555 [Salmonella enterica]|uniref:Ead/Ea22-like family protein n=3 Tax=Salmonella enterica TaxID=28901 RepID=A0A704QY68_SALER|nr:hypothetical protein [Salmonella enterica]EEN1069864.1 hypothetical protein [Salmonella enterica subsp. enterica]OSD45660.1 hypothetical protein R533_07725 [Salmonella enterica subsp. houtenae serovar 40:z4,z32:-]EAT4615930.1 hypothetical protein [Salmonella enterica]EAX5940895.1 hypothetical protein [Salmonella enterica]
MKERGITDGLTMNQLAERNAEYVMTIAELEEKCAAMTAKLSMINDLMEAAEQANKLAHEATEKLVQERNALASLDADKQELKIAELINKFYERYPLASFNKDTDRAEALGYFLAGAELQCFGEFIKYEELFGDE